MSPREQLIQLRIRQLVRPIDMVTESAGPGQFPRTTELWGPFSWLRNQVWRDALGTGSEFDEQAAIEAMDNISSDDRTALLAQCEFIREHTVPLKPWALPENPLLPESFLVDDFHMNAMAVSEAFIAVGEAARQASVKLSEVTESFKPKIVPRPPMWANDPAHTRRTAFGPTRRVK